MKTKIQEKIFHVLTPKLLWIWRCLPTTKRRIKKNFSCQFYLLWFLIGPQKSVRVMAYSISWSFLKQNYFTLKTFLRGPNFGVKTLEIFIIYVLLYQRCKKKFILHAIWRTYKVFFLKLLSYFDILMLDIVKIVYNLNILKFQLSIF